MSRLSILVLVGLISHALKAQTPPIDLEWTALRWFGNGTGVITHDPVTNEHLWALQDDINTLNANDEVKLPFLPDGSDVAPAYPDRFNVGSLDHLVDLTVIDSVPYALMAHQNIGGVVQDQYWHLFAGAAELIIQSPEEDLLDVGLDMQVEADAIYVCGSSMVGTANNDRGRSIKTDLQGNVLWDVLWDPVGTDALGRFSSVVVLGDTVVMAAFPLLVLFDRNTGTFIDTEDPAALTPPLQGDARLVAGSDRIHWACIQGNTLHFGYWSFTEGATGGGGAFFQTYATPPAGLDVVLGENGEWWIGTTAEGQGRLLRVGTDADLLSTSTLYASITDLDFVNGKLSITGKLDATNPTSYVLVGTPQP